MTHSKLGLKALGLCALVLGLMTFGMAGVAQAEVGAVWDILNGEGKLVEVTEASKLFAEVKAEIEKGTTGILEFTTGGGTKVEFAVQLVSGAGLPKLGVSGSLSKGKAKFTGCATFLNEKTSICEAKSKGQLNGTIETEEADGLIVLGTGSVPLVLILPLVKNAKGEPLGAIIETGEECSVGSKVEVTGHLDIADCNGKFKEHLVEHLIIEPEGFRLLKALGQPAKVLGSAIATLAGAHAGLKWAGLPA